MMAEYIILEAAGLDHMVDQAAAASEVVLAAVLAAAVLAAAALVEAGSIN
jgi:hypothetical protein